MASNEEEVRETALANQLVIQKIFEYLNTKELLGVSLVNKLWNYEARCVLRDKRKCAAVIRGERPCLRAKELNKVLGSLNVSFFNGLNIIMEYHASELSRITKRMEDVYENIMETQWKYLEFQGRPVGCLLEQLMLRLMSKSLTLEQLIITDVPFQDKWKDANQPGKAFELPKLRVLQVPESSWHHGHTEFIRGLLAGGPNVEELRTEVTPQWIPNIPVKKLTIIKELFIPYLYGEGMPAGEAIRLLEIFAASEPKLTTLTVYRPSLGDTNVGTLRNYFDHLASIMYSSSETLRKVQLDNFSLFNLGMTRRAKIFPPVLRNVEDLKFEVYFRNDIGISRYFLRVPLAQIFPAVTRVKFFAVFRNVFRDGDEIEQDEIHPWPAVKEVESRNIAWCDQRVAELGILFPCLSSLKVSFGVGVRESHVPFLQLWSSFPCLEELVVDGKLETQWETNLDAEFCGIHPEEIALLQRKDDQYLERVNIVPPFAPITHMKSLKTIQLEVRTDSVLPPGTKPKRFILSKVAGLVALRRMPNLEFRLRAPFEAADQLDHLRSYVKIELLLSNPATVTHGDGEHSDEFEAIVYPWEV